MSSFVLDNGLEVVVIPDRMVKRLGEAAVDLSELLQGNFDALSGAVAG